MRELGNIIQQQSKLADQINMYCRGDKSSVPPKLASILIAYFEALSRVASLYGWGLSKSFIVASKANNVKCAHSR